jgi:hypothetical protein
MVNHAQEWKIMQIALHIFHEEVDEQWWCFQSILPDEEQMGIEVIWATF